MCMHGRIIFSSKIRFDNCGETNASTIIETMKKSGHIPNALVLAAERIRKKSNSKEAIRHELSQLTGKEDDL